MSLRIISLGSAELQAATSDLVQLSCDVIAAGAHLGWESADIDHIRAYWSALAPHIDDTNHVLIAAYDGEELLGTAQYERGHFPTSRHRAEVAKLMVAPTARRRGIASMLMGRLEELATANGVELFVLDTRAGEPVEEMYLARGYTRTGYVPKWMKYASGAYRDTVFFYKALRGGAAARSEPKPRAEIATLIAGVLSLALGMGIGRFAYTLVLPAMTAVPGFDTAAAATVAAWNYAGYFIGALLASHPLLRNHRLLVLRLSLLASVVTSALMAYSTQAAQWSALRLLSGIASAFIFVFVSAIVLDRAPQHARATWSGVLYSGVGIGIFASALLVQLFPRTIGDVHGAWLSMAALAAAFLIASLFGLRRDTVTSEHKATSRQAPAQRTRLYLIYGGFFFEAIGYVIPATFIVHFVNEDPALRAHAAFMWMLVGAFAAPSTIAWSYLSKNRSAPTFAAIAIALQAAGIGAALINPGIVGMAILAATLGFTFVGITSLVIRAAREISPDATSSVISRLTAAFGVGQIAGPLLAAFSKSHAAGVNGALVAAFAAVLISGALLLAAAGSKERMPSPSYARSK